MNRDETYDQTPSSPEEAAGSDEAPDTGAQPEDPSASHGLIDTFTAGGRLKAAREVERREGIPRDLLSAIALTESGRHDVESGENFAWPWTVMAEGKGRYFATEAEARAEVEILLSQGVRNIDVGCMQINLHYHWNAFETLDHAFDPRFL